MQDAPWLIVGLGNPGRQYELNWHNSGFMALEILAQRNKIEISRIRCKGLMGQGRISGQKCLLLRPSTYMNLSGESVREALAYFKIPLNRCLVLFDDIDIPVGQIRIRESGGSGTHNGMRSIIGQLNRDDFPRIRIGIGPQPAQWDIADYVLSDVPEGNRELFWQSLNKAADAVELAVREGLAQAMNLFNRKPI
ncbi:MAG TPA: aminoacyl-tRNA hydrolase [Clostridiales bacterium]|nr:aminoacyl-tRNA hydrolase [Clostridiales bacterium]